jgi:hypothetical protein
MTCRFEGGQLGSTDHTLDPYVESDREARDYLAATYPEAPAEAVRAVAGPWRRMMGGVLHPGDQVRWARFRMRYAALRTRADAEME